MHCRNDRGSGALGVREKRNARVVVCDGRLVKGARLGRLSTGGRSALGSPLRGLLGQVPLAGQGRHGASPSRRSPPPERRCRSNWSKWVTEGSGLASGGTWWSFHSCRNVTVAAPRPTADRSAGTSAAVGSSSAWATLRASSATAPAVRAPARSAAARPATLRSCARWRPSSTSICARVPSASPWALTAAAHRRRARG